MPQMYTDKVMDHFTNPRNMGEIPDADGVGHVGNQADGDLIWIYIRVKDDVLIEVKFKAFGCAAAIATSSMTTEMAKGMNLQDALKLDRENVANSLGGLPPRKMSCSNLGADALHEAIHDYLRKQGREPPLPAKPKEESEQRP